MVKRMYEVTCATYDYDWETCCETQVFDTVQFKKLDEAMEYFEYKKQDVNVEHIKLTEIMTEFHRP